DHRDLDDIRCRSLDRCIHRHPFAKRTLHEIAGFQFRHRSSAPEHSHRISLLLRLLDTAVEKSFDSRVGLKVLFDILLRLFSGNAQILAQPKGTDTIYNPEVHRLRISSLQRRDLIERYKEYLGSSDPVDILRL